MKFLTALFLLVLSFQASAMDLSKVATGDLEIMKDHNTKVLHFLDVEDPEFDEIFEEQLLIVKELKSRIPNDEEEN